MRLATAFNSAVNNLRHGPAFEMLQQVRSFYFRKAKYILHIISGNLSALASVAVLEMRSSRDSGGGAGRVGSYTYVGLTHLRMENI